MTSKPLAFAYVRFSTEKQKKGSSIERQIEKAQAYALKHGLELDDTTYRDLGVSAYRGKNAVEGALGLFIQAVEDGRIPKGSYLLVENFDRMSRNVLSEAQGLLINLVNRGIIVVTMRDEQVFSKATIDSDEGTYKMILALLEMVRARNESVRKAGMVSEGWAKARATKKIFTRMAPAWLYTEDGETWIVDEKKAEVVRLIFKMAHDEGLGAPTIMRRLNDLKIKTFRDADGWSAGIVHHILSNKAVIGTFESAKAGVLEKHFPPIIDRKIFDSVNVLAKQRNFAPGARGEGNIVNLFAGRSFCGLCQAKMKTVSMSGHNAYLQCERSYSNKGCNAGRVPYHAFEQEILKHLIIAQHRSVFKLRDEVEHDPRVGLLAELNELTAQKNNLMGYMMKFPDDPEIEKNYRQLVAKAKAVEAQMQKTAPIPKADVVLRDLLGTYERFEELRQSDRDGDEYKQLRRHLQNGLRNAVKKIEFQHKPAEGNKEYYRVTFLSGTVRERAYFRPAKGFQPGNKRGKR